MTTPANLLPFNLAEAKADPKRIVTRDGRPYTPLTDQARGKQPLLGYIGDETDPHLHSVDGRWIGRLNETGKDLFLLPLWSLTSHLAEQGIVLREGEEWHRTDWTEDMLPAGWRPLLSGERRLLEDEVFGMRNAGPWRAYGESDWISDANAYSGSIFTRTRRPLPPRVRIIPWTQETLPEPWPTLRNNGQDFAILAVSCAGICTMNDHWYDFFELSHHGFTLRNGSPCGTEVRE